jgi:hypothetical protein
MILLAHERVRLICYCLLFWSRVFRLMAPQEPQKKEGLLYPLKIVQYFELPSGIVKRRYFWNYFFVSENEVDRLTFALPSRRVTNEAHWRSLDSTAIGTLGLLCLALLRLIIPLWEDSTSFILLSQFDAARSFSRKV